MATSTMLWEDRSPDSQWPKITAISNILKKGMPDMPTMMRKAISTNISQISDEAQLVAKKWCMGATHHIINHANSRLAKVRDQNQNCIGIEEIDWAIRCLPIKTHLQLGEKQPLENFQILLKHVYFSWIGLVTLSSQPCARQAQDVGGMTRGGG